MRQLYKTLIVICWPGLLFALPAQSAELELDNPIKSSSEHKPAVKPEINPPPTAPNSPKDRTQRPARPDTNLAPGSKHSPEPGKGPAIDPDAEQVNRGALD